MDNESAADLQDVVSQRRAATPSAQAAREWLINALAELLEVDPSTIDTRQPYARYGLDSSAAVGMTDSLGTWLGIEFDETLLYDHPTIEALCDHLVARGLVEV
jgi:acyl carrier protein